ncbi:fatty acid/sphingolipid desaturase [Auriscalpium vulgare]|uniref:Fatty acid/sphingolipid desaturase n=1 Tax=Auriscalpium vulgare TaxID=40419 RepID=A0ACB8S9A1_9AGAM|nr:fatty acid/sphingolipid desaturase [Auriscalpium vulgare]
MQTFTKERVRELGYMIIDRKVYSVKEFGLSGHPGGTLLIDHLGHDASDTFEAMHPESAYETLANFYVGDLEASEKSEDDPFTLDARALNESLRKQGFYDSDPLYYATLHVINFALLATAIYGVHRFGHTIPGVLFSGTTLALFFQQAALLSHDFCHKQISNNHFVIYAGALVWGELLQGLSKRWWVDKHSRHHSMPNIYGNDPDIESRPVIAWSEHALELFTDVDEAELTKTLAKVLYVHQVFLYFPVLFAARLQWNYESLLAEFVKADSHLAWFDGGALLLHWYAFATLTRVIPSWPLRALFVFVAIGMSGQFLAMVFAPNHNGRTVLTKEEWDTSKFGFFELQVRTSRDICSGVVGDWFSGALNQQVTHHMFPRMPRSRYRSIQPQVKALCEKHGIPYHQTGFFRGQYEVLSRLNDVANAARKLRAGKQ